LGADRGGFEDVKGWLEAIDRRPTFVATLVIAMSVGLAIWNRFIQDDAMISFRYSANLVAGHGLVWNPGEFVEGYTNFLWVLIMSVPIGLGLDPVVSSQVIGIALFTGTLVIVYALAARILQSTTLAAVVVLLVGSNYTFSAYATGGLETQLQAFLFSSGLLCTWWIVRAEVTSPRALMLLSFVFSLAMWTRLDSSVLFVVPYSLVLLKIVRDPGDMRHKAWLLGCAASPAILLVGGWLGWKLWYYGDILPNTWYAKAGVGIPFDRGLRYVSLFFNSYGLTPFLFVIPFALRPTKRRFAAHSTLAVILILWLIYLLRIGGGFMEFRFFVPVIPLLFILLVGVVDCFARPIAIVALVLIPLSFSFNHARTFHFEKGIESISLLERHLTHPEEGWFGVGRTLAKLFPEPSDVTIAVTAAGVVPYTSGLKTIDMLGLIDPWVARNGIVQGDRAGHQRIAPLSYLVHREVHLVVGHPLMIPIEGRGKLGYSYADLRQMYIPIFDHMALPAGARMIEIPINDEYLVAILYLLPHSDVDRAIAEAGLNTIWFSNVAGNTGWAPGEN
jgi:arabinofuranosyltransferase